MSAVDPMQVMSDLTDHGWAYPPGGPVAGHGEQRITVERAGTCPNGHPWYRIGGSPYVEHISGPGDTDVLFCRYAATYQPKEADDARD